MTENWFFRFLFVEKPFYFLSCEYDRDRKTTSSNFKSLALSVHVPKAPATVDGKRNTVKNRIFRDDTLNIDLTIDRWRCYSTAVYVLQRYSRRTAGWFRPYFSSGQNVWQVESRNRCRFLLESLAHSVYIFRKFGTLEDREFWTVPYRWHFINAH